MKRIIIYISDHGLGHAARDIGLVRKLNNVEVIIKNSNSFEFLKKNLPGIKIINQKTDVGPTFDWNLNQIDIKRTYSDYEDLITNQNEWIQRETEFIKSHPVDLIVSDISPLALRLAKKIKCNAISISNFSWVDIIEKFPDSDEKKRILNWLMESFSLSELTIKLPLSMKLRGFSNIKDANLLCRDTTDVKNNILEKLGLKNAPIVIYSGNQIVNISNLQKESDADLVLMHQNGIFVNGKNIHGIDVEGQDLIASSTCVISKIGYSVISEGLKFCKPMLLIPRIGYAEDQTLYEKVKEYSIARTIDYQKNKMLKIPNLEEIETMRASINVQKTNNLFDKQDADVFIKEFLMN